LLLPIRAWIISSPFFLFLPYMTSESDVFLWNPKLLQCSSLLGYKIFPKITPPKELHKTIHRGKRWSWRYIEGKGRLLGRCVSK
jgi:hypothetical protein